MTLKKFSELLTNKKSMSATKVKEIIDLANEELDGKLYWLIRGK